MKKGYRLNSNFAYQQYYAQFGVMDWAGKQVKRLGGATARTVSSAGRGIDNMSQSMANNAIDGFNKIKKPNRFNTAMTDAQVRAGMLGMDAGRAIRGAGAALNRNKGLVGAGVLGTGALAAGGAGYLGYNALNKYPNQQPM